MFSKKVGFQLMILLRISVHPVEGVQLYMYNATRFTRVPDNSKQSFNFSITTG